MFGLRIGRLGAVARAVRELFSPAKLFTFGEPGVWYDPSDITLGWRYNLLTRTEQFDNAAWVKNNVTVTANAVTAPDGTTTADTLSESGVTGQFFVASPVEAFAPGVQYTQSVFAKAGSNSVVQLVFASGPWGVNAYANFDLATGTVGTVGSTATASIVSVGGGWYRCAITATTTAAANGAGSVIALCDNSTTAARAPSYTGDGTSGIYIWGASLTTAANADRPYQKITDGVQDYFTYQPQPVLFQDAAGTTPVTAVEQPVGLILDKSKGLVLGPELVTNGDFSGGTTGWAIGATTAIIGGAAVSTATPSGSNIIQQSAVQPGANKMVLVSFTVSSWTGGNLRIFINNNALTLTGANGTLSAYIFSTASTGSGLLIRADNSAFTGTIDNISVRELFGNHATQTTSTSRPVLSARYNLLTKTEQFDDAAWTKSNATVTANAAVAPDGTMTADRLVTGGVAGTLKSVNQSFSAAAATYTSGIYVKDNGGVARSVELFFATHGLTATVGTNYNFDTDTLTNYSSAGPFTLVSSSRTFVGNGWYRIGITIAVSSAQSILIYAAAPYLAAQIGDYYIWGASLVPANQASLPYQRVNTATDYDADPSKFKPYLRFDGVDDWLVTPTITPGTDKAQVFAGVRKLVAQDAVFIEQSSDFSANAGSFVIISSGTSIGHYFGLRGSGTGAYNSPFAAPQTSVQSVAFDIGGSTLADEIKPRVNGAIPSLTVITAGPAGTGNFLAYPLYIGRRGGTTFPFNGQLYGLIVRFGANLPAGTIASTENWVAGKTGITL